MGGAGKEVERVAECSFKTMVVCEEDIYKLGLE